MSDTPDFRNLLGEEAWDKAEDEAYDSPMHGGEGVDLRTFLASLVADGALSIERDEPTPLDGWPAQQRLVSQWTLVPTGTGEKP